MPLEGLWPIFKQFLHKSLRVANVRSQLRSRLGAKLVPRRVARWFVFKPKIPIWVDFGGSCYGKSWYILLPFGLFYCHWKYLIGHLVDFVVIWYFGPKKIWQPWCLGTKLAPSVSLKKLALAFVNRRAVSFLFQNHQDRVRILQTRGSQPGLAQGRPRRRGRRLHLPLLDPQAEVLRQPATASA
jgi:hypothetical protein